MRRLPVSSRLLRTAPLAAAIMMTAVAVPAMASAKAAPAAVSISCDAHIVTGDNWAEGFCTRSDGHAISYQEHVKCSNGKTFDGNIVKSTDGNPNSRATCVGANNLLFGESITHT